MKSPSSFWSLSGTTDLKSGVKINSGIVYFSKIKSSDTKSLITWKQQILVILREIFISEVNFENSVSSSFKDRALPPGKSIWTERWISFKTHSLHILGGTSYLHSVDMSTQFSSWWHLLPSVYVVTIFCNTVGLSFK